MSFSAKIRFNMLNENGAKNLYGILSPEVRADKRVNQSMKISNSSLSLEIAAMDRRIFKAVTSSYSNWIRIYEITGGIN